MLIITKLIGTTPLILHRFSDEAAENASSGTRSSKLTTDRGTPYEQCEQFLYKGLNDELVIPQPNLLRSIIDGGRFTKIGRSQITTERKSELFSCLTITAATIPLIYRQPWKVDTRAVRIPATGGRILRHRPMFDDWGLEFEMELDTEILSGKLLRKIVDDAGSRVGLGDFRPATKGPYGKYRVDLWEEQQ